MFTILLGRDEKQFKSGDEKCFALLLQILDILCLASTDRKKSSLRFKPGSIEGIDTKKLVIKLLEVSMQAASPASKNEKPGDDRRLHLQIYFILISVEK